MWGHRQPAEVDRAQEALKRYERSTQAVTRAALDQVDANAVLAAARSPHDERMHVLAAGVLEKIGRPQGSH